MYENILTKTQKALETTQMSIKSRKNNCTVLKWDTMQQGK